MKSHSQEEAAGSPSCSRTAGGSGAGDSRGFGGEVLAQFFGTDVMRFEVQSFAISDISI